MKRIAVVILIMCAAADARALPGPDTTKMTCSAVQGVIESVGAVFLHYRSERTGVMLYNRYVRDRQFCASNETTAPASVPTSDDKSCPVRICVDTASQR
jgi:hypothetical protein